jgi:hypothetical protein
MTWSYPIGIYQSHYLFFELPFFVHILQEKLIINNDQKILLKPYMNKDDSELIFTEIENEISQFCNKGEVLICGQFNARTGGLHKFQYLSIKF